MNKEPRLEVDQFGTKFYYKRDELHRIDGPAYEDVSGIKQWFICGRRHRIDGPAVEYPDGEKFWFYNDQLYSKEDWFQQLTPEQQYNYIWNLDE